MSWYTACHQLRLVSYKRRSAPQQLIFNTLDLGLILTWTRINVFRCMAYCIIHLVILLYIFNLHPRLLCNYAHEGTSNAHLQFMNE